MLNAYHFFCAVVLACNLEDLNGPGTLDGVK